MASSTSSSSTSASTSPTHINHLVLTQDHSLHPLQANYKGSLTRSHLMPNSDLRVVITITTYDIPGRRHAIHGALGNRDTGTRQEADESLSLFSHRTSHISCEAASDWPHIFSARLLRTGDPPAQILIDGKRSSRWNTPS